MFRNIQVVGFRPYSFTGNDGKAVNLKEVHYTSKDEKAEGLVTGYVSLADETVKKYGLAIGKTYNANFYFDTGKKKFVLVDIE